MRRWFVPLVFTALALAAAVPALGAGPVLHEPIPPDPHEDLALAVALDGKIPAAIDTPSGIVGAPDPRRLPSPSDATYGPGADHENYMPDRDTKRPEVGGYDEPFTPSTAPFKRLEAFDAVREDYQLYVRDERLTPVQAVAQPGPEDEAFYADFVVDVAPGRNVRIPSVGPGTSIVRARLGVGAEELQATIEHDGADNWFLLAGGVHTPTRARMVAELSIPRATWGGQIADPSWSDLQNVPPLPETPAHAAALVRDAIGVSRQMRPRQAIAKMVEYFRGFADSDDPPQGRGDVYLDLAFSKKGVCRHRAFAFLVTAQSMGIPTRMVINEAHAWVEVNDSVLWRRIDLGGAGHMRNPASNSVPDRQVYKPPPDAFSWPQGSERGDDMVADARQRAAQMAGGQPGGGAGGDAGGSPSSQSSPASSFGGGSSGGGGAGTGGFGGSGEHDDRPASTVDLTVGEADAHRGLPLHVQGAVSSDGETCAHVEVELWLRDAKTQRMILLGTVATGDDGAYTGGIVVPGTTPLGDYDLVARTPGDARCGVGGNL
jgi:hypothetical protein